MSLEIFSMHMIFRILTFGLFVGALFYLFKRYILNYLKEQVLEKEKGFENLRQEKQNFVKQQNLVEKELSAQEKSLKNLQQKLLEWQKKFKEEIILRQEELEKNHAKLEKKIIRQQEQLEFFYLQKQVVPETIDSVTQKVKKDFEEDEKKSKLFVNQIMEYLNK